MMFWPCHAKVSFYDLAHRMFIPRNFHRLFHYWLHLAIISTSQLMTRIRILNSAREKDSSAHLNVPCIVWVDNINFNLFSSKMFHAKSCEAVAVITWQIDDLFKSCYSLNITYSHMVGKSVQSLHFNYFKCFEIW